MTLELQGGDRWQVIDELINHLVVSGKVAPENRETIAAAVREREMSLSTGIGLGIALPHASTDLVSEVVEIIGLSKKGIDFTSVDGKLVHKVCLFLVPQGQFHKHVNVLAELAKRLHEEGF